MKSKSVKSATLPIPLNQRQELTLIENSTADGWRAAGSEVVDRAEAACGQEQTAENRLNSGHVGQGVEPSEKQQPRIHPCHSTDRNRSSGLLGRRQRGAAAGCRRDRSSRPGCQAGG